MEKRHKAIEKSKKMGKKPNVYRSLIRGTEGKYSGYSHHPDYKAGDDIRVKPKK